MWMTREWTSDDGYTLLLSSSIGDIKVCCSTVKLLKEKSDLFNNDFRIRSSRDSLTEYQLRLYQ